jgi:phosphopantothenoylcysteine decarboxylase/phosphopantothenate--cysteine ligase
MSLSDHRLLIGICGGIAAYKMPQVVRGLQGQGADVRVVCTAAAARFVTPATLETLTRHRVHQDMFARDDDFPVLHVGLGGWATAVLVAPATAHTVARMAHGLADDLLTAILLSTRAPVYVAPSMEEHMLDHPATRTNLELLVARGCTLIEPATGVLASGASGRGRLPEPEELVQRLAADLAPRGNLTGVRLLVTAGPTIEDLDPVRYLANRSTGKMGYALAMRARDRGAQVQLVTGPVSLPAPAGVAVTRVRSALEMQQAVALQWPTVDAAILAAAPCDYRPRERAVHKLHAGGMPPLELVPNPDIAAGLGRDKGDRLLVIFALESEAGLDRARDKRQRKNADLVVLNNLRDPGAGPETDTNVVTLIDRQDQVMPLPRMDKAQVADRILDWLAARCAGRPEAL